MMSEKQGTGATAGWTDALFGAMGILCNRIQMVVVQHCECTVRFTFIKCFILCYVNFISTLKENKPARALGLLDSTAKKGSGGAREFQGSADGNHLNICPENSSA